MSKPNIRLGLQIPSFTYPNVGTDNLFETISDIAVTAENSGFDSVYVMDHFYQLPLIGRPEENMFEAYTLLSAIAARTNTVKLGCMVGGMTYRNPAFLAKQKASEEASEKALADLEAALADTELKTKHIEETLSPSSSNADGASKGETE